jgi:hypothetical protein
VKRFDYTFVSKYNYPVSFAFPAGRIDDDNPIVFWEKLKFEVTAQITIVF